MTCEKLDLDKYFVLTVIDGETTYIYKLNPWEIPYDMITGDNRTEEIEQYIFDELNHDTGSVFWACTGEVIIS